jgi:UDP:flavonoid glycosyltransferase YjiC (YdhE family)
LEPWIGHSLQLALAPGPLFRGTFPRREGIVIAHHYPMAELYPAFDAAIAAAGYNTATELLHHGVPTVLMPQPRQVDDQQARAAAAAAAGAALMLEAGDAESLRAAVRKILEPNTAAEMRRTSMGCIPENGARTAAAAILDCIGCLPQPDAPQTEGSSDAA